MDFVEEQGVSIVANGSFNPAIFHPSWLTQHGIIAAEEEQVAKLEITHPEVSQFSIPGLKFDIQTERTVLHGSTEPFIRTAEVFAQLFSELLPHTPIKSIGINYWVHFRTSDWAQRQRFARTLAPVEPWGKFGEEMESKDRALAGGFSTLSMRLPRPDFGEGGAINAQMQPSSKVENDVGVFLNINHHFSDFMSENAGIFILNNYDKCIQESRSLINYMIEKARSS